MGCVFAKILHFLLTEASAISFIEDTMYVCHLRHRHQQIHKYDLALAELLKWQCIFTIW